MENQNTMTDTNTRPELPDHLSIDPQSPHFVAAVFEHDVGIRFNDKERFDVEDYCMSEGLAFAEISEKRMMEERLAAWRAALHEARERRYWASRDIVTSPE